MNHDLRFELGPHWGTNRPAFPLALNSGPLYEAAKRYGRIKNIRELREADENDVAVAPLGLARRMVFPESFCEVDKWIDQSGNGGAYLDVWDRGFNDTPVMGHFSNKPSLYMSNPASAIIPANAGHALRLFLYEGVLLLVLRWGRYQFVLNNGETALMRLSSGWTQSQEDALNAILTAETISSEAQDEADSIREAIYSDYTELDLGLSSFYNDWFTLEFEAEDAGYVSARVSNNPVTVVPNTDALNTRQPGVLWNDSPLTIKSSGGKFFWQPGYPEYSPSGETRLRFKTGYWTDSLAGAVSYNGNWHKPAGTDITFTHNILDSVWAEIVVKMTTSNPRRTPFLYAAQAYVDAGERSGGDCSGENVVLDTADLSEDVITKLDVSQEGDFRRLQADIEVSDVLDDDAGEVFQSLGENYEIGEHRTGNVYVGDTRLIKNGIVTPSQWQDLKAFTPNQARSFVAWPSTLANFSIHDQWFLLEEYELEGGELVGDGLHLCGLFRRGLRLLGIPYVNMLFADDDGPYITPAAPGESWTEVSQEGTLADYFRYLLERYAFGAQLWIDGDANWRYGYRSTSVKTLFGHPVNFTSSLANYDPDSYPGRFAIIEELDLSRTLEAFYNEFKAVGKNGYHDGAEPLARTGTIHESIKRGLGPASKKHLGRKRRMRTVSGDWRTLADVNYGLRSVMLKNGGIPNFRAFKSHFIPGLFVADIVRVDSILSRVFALSDGAAHEDDSTLVTQEVEEAA